MNNKTIAIIPTRGGSKSLPNKNMLLLGGILLIAHNILYAKANDAIIGQIYVHPKIIEILKRLILNECAKF